MNLVSGRASIIWALIFSFCCVVNGVSRGEGPPRNNCGTAPLRVLNPLKLVDEITTVSHYFSPNMVTNPNYEVNPAVEK